MGKVNELTHPAVASPIELALACGERLRVHRFSVREAVSSLFAVHVLARSPDPCVDLEAIVDQPAALRIASGFRFAYGGERLWSGICHHARLVQAVDVGPAEVGLSTYEIAIVPRLWLLTQRSDHRVFQHLSIPGIVQMLLDGWDIPTTWHLDAGAHPRLAYKVQYGESDFAFVSRLLEEAGIAYVFADDDGEGSRLVLSDALHWTAHRRDEPIAHVEQPNGAAEWEYVTRVSIDERVRPGAVVLRDYDFQRPAFAMHGHARHDAPALDARLERYRYAPGAFMIMSRNDPRRTTHGSPKRSKIPDVVVVKDPTKPPTRDNIEKVIEVKFPPDHLDEDQADAYKQIAGENVPFEEFSPERCGCPDGERKQEQEVTAQDVMVVALLAALVIVLLMDDVVPGGQVDDAAIPPLIQGILSRIAPLLRGFRPVMP